MAVVFDKVKEWFARKPPPVVVEPVAAEVSPEPEPVKPSMHRVDKPMRPRMLRKPCVAWIVHCWLRDFIENSDDVWHLSDDLADDMREWCLARDIKPAPIKEFLSVLKGRRDWVKKERPWRLNEYEHGYAMQRLRARGRRLDSRPHVYFFFESARNIGPVNPEWDSGGIEVEQGTTKTSPKCNPSKPKHLRRVA